MNRPRRAKAVAKPVQKVELPPLEKKPPTGDFFKDTYPSSASDIDEESDCSDYGKRNKTKKRKSGSHQLSKTKSPAKKRVKVREPSAELSELSEIDSEDDREEDVPTFSKQNRVAPPVKATITAKILKLEIRSAPTTISINLAQLFPDKFNAGATATHDVLEGDTLLADSNNPGSKLAHGDRNSLAKMRRNPKYASFLELEPDLRNEVYRQYLVGDQVVKFNPAPRAGRETAILRVCKQVYDEGRGILYGSNAFHFERISQSRGRYFDNERREIGYKDVRRFLETIGSHNIAKLRFLSMDFSDATPGFTPSLDSEERRFVNDPVLTYVLKMIGRSDVILDKFVVGFVGRAEVSSSDVAFIRALTSISCHKLVKTCAFGHSRINVHLYNKMRTFMTKPQNAEIDEQRRKGPKMESDGRQGRWTCHHRCT